MQKFISVYKPAGLTPLEVIKQVKLQIPKLASVPITYAGRLDPLAHGVLLLLIGEEAKKRYDYLSIPKSYTFEAVFGIETDTYDLLGYVKNKETKPLLNVNLFVNTFVKSHVGKQLQFYPPYSSKPVHSKPLFWWAKNNRLEEIEIPQKEIEIFSFKCLSKGKITLVSLKQRVEKAVAAVHGDFRQKEILQCWEALFSQYENKTITLPTATFSISCSSGTYVRGLVHQLGKDIGCGAVAIDILRTAIGEYTLNNVQRSKFMIG